MDSASPSSNPLPHGTADKSSLSSHVFFAIAIASAIAGAVLLCVCVAAANACHRLKHRRLSLASTVATSIENDGGSHVTIARFEEPDVSDSGLAYAPPHNILSVQTK